MSIILAALIASITMFVPGILLALALLKGTRLHLFEVLVIGFIFGLIAPATLTWADSYFMSYFHAFAFSMQLFEVNALIITIVAAAICYKEGVFSDILNAINKPKETKEDITDKTELQKEISSIRKKLGMFEKAKPAISKHIKEEEDLQKKQSDEMALVGNFTEEEKKKVIELHNRDLLNLHNSHMVSERALLDSLEAKPEKTNKEINKWIWIALLSIMILTFATRMFSAVITPVFFEFDPYFDMLGAQAILNFGYQPLLSHSAWPIVANGTVIRIQPLIPYLEAYWYSIANSFSYNYTSFNTTLMSNVSGVYPPITAALLVFVVFMLLYKEYDEYIGLIGAAFAATMPVLFTTFVSGEQLLEPWGLFSLFFFFATYMIAIKEPKNARLAILAGIAYASTFLGAHYYTVDAAVLAAYILIQGFVNVIRNDMEMDFYKMNAIVIAVIGIFLAVYYPYHATLSGRIPTMAGIPITVGFPLFALLLIALVDLVPKLLYEKKILKKFDNKIKWEWILLIVIIAILVIVFTPIRNTFLSYINLSTKFTTPSTPLFMTVQEFEPTGLTYNFGAAGLGMIAQSFFGAPLFVYAVLAVSMLLLLISIVYRKSKTAMLYIWITFPLAVAAFSEVKYLPHFGVAYIILIGIIMGEAAIYIGNNFSFKLNENYDMRAYVRKAYSEHRDMMFAIFAIAIFFLSPIIAAAFLLIIIILNKAEKKNRMWVLLVVFLLIEIVSFAYHSPILGESGSITQAFYSAINYQNQNIACNNSIGADLFCNVVPGYWLQALQWMKTNIGPNGPRVVSWWDYGDWINWFGQTPTVIRGDNSQPIEDFGVAANYVLGPKDGYTPGALANYLNGNQTRYIIFDNGLIQKWGALDFLACINVNETSMAFAIDEAKQANISAPYILGQSKCELSHDPQYVLVPLATLIPSQSPSINDYCSITNNTAQFAYSYLVVGNSLSNKTVCVDLNQSKSGTMQIYNSNGTKLNAVIQVASEPPLGEVSLSQNGPPYLEFLMVYLPNGPNDTVTNAPSEFYNSNFYRGYFFGKLPGFTQVYPANATGINYVNGTYPIRILELNNYTGKPVPHTPKPSYVNNNYTFP